MSHDDDLSDILAHPAVEYVEWVHRPTIRLVPPVEDSYTDGSRDGDCCEAIVADALRRLELCGIQATSIGEGIAQLYRQKEAAVARARELEMTMTHRREISMDW